MFKFSNVSYKIGQKEIIKEATFEINSGDKVVIVGSNGSGKTTLAKILIGLYKPSSGSATYKEEKIHSSNLLRNEVGFVFQNPLNQFVYPIVFTDLLFSLELRGFSVDGMEARIDEVLNKLELSHLKNNEVTNLSEGEQQRVAIASQIILDNKVIILDEPTSMLDPISKKEVGGLIEDSNFETRINITHSLDVIKNSTNVLFVDDGIVKSLSPKEFVESDIYLEKCRISRYRNG